MLGINALSLVSLVKKFTLSVLFNFVDSDGSFSDFWIFYLLVWDFLCDCLSFGVFWTCLDWAKKAVFPVYPGALFSH